MATWSRKGEAREFWAAETEYVNIGADLRAMGIERETVVDVFPMLIEGEASLHFDNYTLAYSAGTYSRDMALESKRHYVMVKPKPNIGLRLGRFFPTFGIGTNDHSLFIKNDIGLGRGSETYNAELWYINRWFEFFATASTLGFQFETQSDGFFENDFRNQAEFWLRGAYIGTNKLEAGLQAKMGTQTVVGGFLRYAPWWTFYKMLEVNYVVESGAIISYGRMGIFPYRGIDLFFDTEHYYDLPFREISRYALGGTWMIVPRVEIEAKTRFEIQGNLMRRQSYIMLHLWL